MFISLLCLKRYRSDDESRKGTNTRDPTVDFEQEESRTENEEDEDVGLPPELERIIS